MWPLEPEAYQPDLRPPDGLVAGHLGSEHGCEAAGDAHSGKPILRNAAIGFARSSAEATRIDGEVDTGGV